MPAFLLACCLLLAPLAQEKTYDLKLNAPRKAGQKFQMQVTQHMKMQMNANGQPAGGKEEKKLMEGAEEVVSADPEGAYELRWTFSKAQQLAGAEMVPYGFDGKTVKVKKAGKDADKEYSYADGSPVAEADLKGLKDFDGDGKGDVSKILAPGKPVKVGESWEPDVKAAAGMFEKDMADAIDPAKSKARFTLKSVEQRGGAEFGRIEGILEFSLGSMGPLKLETPMLMKFDIEMDARLDGGAQEGVMKLKAQLKGESDVEAQGQKIRIAMDLNMVGAKTKTLAK